EFLHGPDARRVDGEQEVVVGLQMKGARARRAGDEIEHLRARRVAHVHGRDAVAEAMPDIGVAAMHHDLDAVAAAAEVAMPDELDVAGCNGIHIARSLVPTCWSMIFSENRYPPRVKSGASFFGMMLYAACVGSSPPPRNSCPMR